MRYLKSYKLWENLSNNRNELYRDLVDILYTDIFDEFNISERTDEVFDDNSNPENKFWNYRLEFSKNSNDDTSNFDEIGDKKINSIVIYNISEDEKDKFWNILYEEVRQRVKSQLNQELVIFEESVFVDNLNADVYDYVLKLRNLPEDHKPGTKNLPKTEKVKYWLNELDKWYTVQSSEILNQKANYVTVANYKTVYLSGPLFNKSKTINAIYVDMIEHTNITNPDSDHKLGKTDAADPCLMSAIKQWVDSHSK